MHYEESNQATLKIKDKDEEISYLKQKLEFQHEIELKEKENLMNELLESREEVKRAYLEI